MNKVVVTRPFMGICGMQVCAHKDATDEEILAVCNGENPSGTSVVTKETAKAIDMSGIFKMSADEIDAALLQEIAA